MATGLNQRSLARRDRIAKSIEHSNQFLSKIRMDWIEELCRRDMISVGVASNSGSPGFAISRKGSSSSTSPTERNVLAKYGNKDNGPDIEKHVHDPVREELKKIERKIFDAEENLRQAYESMEFLRVGVEKERGRKPSVPCEACLILPAVKMGFCHPCYVEWTELGAPDRQRYVAYKTQALSSEGKILVTDAPPARHRLPDVDYEL